jgi:hypothetical protein
MPKKNLQIDGYYFDGSRSYTLYKDKHGKSVMEEQADSIQQGYQDGLKFKLQQIKEINNEHSET